MSKPLSKILVDLHANKSTYEEAEQQIKDLVLRSIDDAYTSDSRFENDEMATEMWHKICNKVKAL